MSHWYIKSGDAEIQGPFTEKTIVAGLVQRIYSRSSLINAAGSSDWCSIGSHPPFRAALAARQGTPRASSKEATLVGTLSPEVAPAPRVVDTPRWRDWVRVTTTLCAVLGLATLVAMLLAQTRAAEAARADAEAARASVASLESRIDRLRADVASLQTSTFADMTAFASQCAGWNGNATCTFTNTSNLPLRTCWRARVSLKSAPGVQLESLLGCTGRIEPHATVSSTVPWLRGNADDVCKSKSAFGTDHLDWSVCTIDFLTAKPE